MMVTIIEFIKNETTLTELFQQVRIEYFRLRKKTVRCRTHILGLEIRLPLLVRFTV